jgi:hypothetical protein
MGRVMDSSADVLRRLLPQHLYTAPSHSVCIMYHVSSYLYDGLRVGDDESGGDDGQRQGARYVGGRRDRQHHTKPANADGEGWPMISPVYWLVPLSHYCL